MRYQHNTNFSAKALKAAEESLGKLIESTAAVAGCQNAFPEISFRKCLQGQKLSLSLPLRINNNVNLSFSAGKVFSRKKYRYGPCIGWIPSGKPGGAKYGRDVVVCSHHLSAGHLSFKML